MKRALFMLGALCFTYTQGQTLTVIDKTSREKLPGAVILSAKIKNPVFTNAKGKADISVFKGEDSLSISFSNYKTVYASFIELESKKFNLELEESNIYLSEVIVSANRWEEDKIETPARIEELKRKDVAFQNPQTTADALETSGYVFVQKSQMAGGSPSLRGFATNRVLLVVDGVRMNNAIFRSGNLQNVISVDANALENAEVLFGPGAVMYGSDAIGGVMDFHTLKPKFADSTGKILFTGNVMGRYSTANTEKTGHIDFNIATKKWSFLNSISYADYEDLRAGSMGNRYFLRPSYQKTVNGKDSTFANIDSSLQVNSAFSQLNLMQKIHFKPNKSWQIEYDAHYSASSNSPRYDRLVLDANSDGVLDNAEWYYGPQIWMMHRLGVKSNASTKLYDQIKAGIAYQNHQETRHDRRFNSKQLRNQFEKVDAVSLNLDVDKKLSDKLILFYGAEAVYNKIGSRAYRKHIETNIETPSTTRYPNGSTWEAYGAYASLKYKLNSKLILHSGTRYSYYKIKAEFDTTLFPLPFVTAQNSNGALNGSLGMVFNPLRSFQFYVNASTGFRAPNVDDMGKVFESQPGSVVVPNANLKPEYAYSAEVGFVKIFGNYLKIDAVAYYTLLKNALARRNFSYNGSDSIIYDGQLSEVLAIQNITQAYVYGLQGGVEINFGHGIGVKSTISFQKGEEQSEDSLKYYPKPHVPPLFGATHLTYKRKKIKLDLYMQYNKQMRFEELPLVDRTDNISFAKTTNGLPFVPCWYTLNFKAAYYVNNYVSVNAGIENITDQLYRTYSSGISAPGRNFIISVRAKF